MTYCPQRDQIRTWRYAIRTSSIGICLLLLVAAPPAPAQETHLLKPGATIIIEGELTTADPHPNGSRPVDTYIVTVPGGPIAIDVYSSDVDTYLHVALEEDDGHLATIGDDDGGADTDSRLAFKLTHARIVCISVTSIGAGEYGRYRLLLTSGTPGGPFLPFHALATVLELQDDMDDRRQAFAEQDMRLLASTIASAEQIVAIRESHQADWPDGRGPWWELRDSELQVAELRRLQTRSAEETAELRDARIEFDIALESATPETAAEALRDADRSRLVMQCIMGDDHPDVLEALIYSGYALYSLHQYTDAEPYFREAMEKQRRVLGPDHPSTLLSVTLYGAVLARLDRPGEAEPYHREALEGRRRVLGSNHRDTVASLLDYAHLLHALGRDMEAQPYRRQALECKRRILGNEDPSTMASLYVYGVRVLALDCPMEAEPYLREALELRQSVLGYNHPDTLHSLDAYGLVMESLGRNAEALLYWRAAMDGRRRVLGEDHPLTLGSLEHYGSALWALDRPAQAEPYLRAAVEGRRRVLGELHPHTLRSLGRLGCLLRLLDRPTDAEPYCRQALEGWRQIRGDDDSEYLDSLADYGNLLHDLGRPAEARSCLRDALAGCRRTLGNNHPLTFSVLQSHVLGLHDTDDAGEVLSAYRELLEITERLRVETVATELQRAEKANEYDLAETGRYLAWLELDQGDCRLAHEAMERSTSRALLDLIERGREGAAKIVDPALLARIAAARERESETRQAVVSAEHRLATMRESLRRDAAGSGRRAEEVRMQRAEVERLRQLLSERTLAVFRLLRDAYPVARPLQASELQASLGADEAIVQFGWLNAGAALAMALDARHLEGGEIGVREPSVEALEASVEALKHDCATRGALAADDVRLRQLREGLFPSKVGEMIDAAKRVVIIPDGPLNGLPFGLLLPDKEVSYAASATMYVDRVRAARAQADTERSKAVLVVGDPDFGNAPAPTRTPSLDEPLERVSARANSLDDLRLHGGRLSRLCGTRLEALAIDRLAQAQGLDSTALLQARATAPEVAAAAKHSPRFLHLATHGLLGDAQRPYDVSLALTQPKVPTAEDIGFLRLEELVGNWQGHLARTELVTLSACQTNVGEQRGDSMISLPWGFFFAGAPTVVASLWQVDDEATALLMQRFYENLLGAHNDTRSIRGRSYGANEALTKLDALDEAKLWLRTLTHDEAQAARERLYESAGEGPTDCDEKHGDSLLGWLSDRGRLAPAVAANDVARPAEPVGFGLVDWELPKSEEELPYDHPYFWAPFVLIGSPE
ncbi:MAG: CHAT domain-containing protein [Phycisphaerae bacterium]|jgi:CHAT domain-containing protein/tetratricopeptide (TPR) repeat protein